MPLVRPLLCSASIALCLFASSLAPGTAAAAPSPPGAAEKDADAAFEKQDWATAARGYESLAKGTASKPRHVMRWAIALHKQRKLSEAASAYERVIALKAPQATAAHYNLACIYATGKQPSDRDRALAELTAAVDGGTAPQPLRTDPDLAPLRTDPRFVALLDKAERAAFPCKHPPEYRQFDFWLGEWDVFAGPNRAGSSRIEKAAEGCLVVEHWTSSSGNTGKSLNFYLARERRWRQTWVGSDGDVVEFTGVVHDGEMRFSAAGWTATGEPFYRRLTFSPKTEGGVTRVRQLGEISKDGGRTYSVEYDLLYVPPGARSQPGAQQ